MAIISLPPSDLVTDAGFPDPHVALLNQMRGVKPLSVDTGVRVVDIQDDLVGAKIPHEKEEDTANQDCRDVSDIDDMEAFIARVLSQVTPCARRYPLTLTQSVERQRIQSISGNWTPVRGMRVIVKPANEDDCILLVASGTFAPETDNDASEWSIFREGHPISPKTITHCRQQGGCQHLCIPYLDQPGRRGEIEYEVRASAGSGTTRFEISPESQRRSFFAVDIPAYQVAWVEDDVKHVLQPGPWVDIAGLTNMVTTIPGDRVLVLCLVHYTAQWSSEFNRGRFTVVRDDIGLDGPADRGLQSVRALSPALRRTLLIATVDEPPPGPHLYRVRGTITARTETGVFGVLEGVRQLSLVRLPGSATVGPVYSDGPCVVNTSWTEIPGLSLSIGVPRARDRIMLVYHVDCHAHENTYEIQFTLIRRGGRAGGQLGGFLASARLDACADPLAPAKMKADTTTGAASSAASALRFSEDITAAVVRSDDSASSEYPVGIICDTPGTAGVCSYAVAARVADVGTGRANATVGYSGSLTAVVLSASSAAAARQAAAS
eukprot:TRINITY_DN57642_c0_g1_i1.p1 TRINITY_DN57642_c0_g1~~TRINITY_DN57642_c0_g1_i1.p1  ORF type:complete len:549 (-),score=46.76 TRINITY_DN57642_c0_g1_i1:95-1741(-)